MVIMKSKLVLFLAWPIGPLLQCQGKMELIQIFDLVLKKFQITVSNALKSTGSYAKQLIFTQFRSETAKIRTTLLGELTHS